MVLCEEHNDVIVNINNISPEQRRHCIVTPKPHGGTIRIMSSHMHIVTDEQSMRILISPWLQIHFWALAASARRGRGNPRFMFGMVRFQRFVAQATHSLRRAARDVGFFGDHLLCTLHVIIVHRVCDIYDNNRQISLPTHNTHTLLPLRRRDRHLPPSDFHHHHSIVSSVSLVNSFHLA